MLKAYSISSVVQSAKMGSIKTSPCLVGMKRVTHRSVSLLFRTGQAQRGWTHSPWARGRASATGRAHRPLHCCQREPTLRPQDGLTQFGNNARNKMVTYTSPKFLARLPSPPLGVSTPLTGGQGLLQFLGLLFVCDDQGVKVSAAPNFKLHIILIFLDLDSYQRDQNWSFNCITEKI